MKAVVVHEFGNSDVLRLEELPDPVPGVNEVIVESPRRRSTTSTSTCARASRASRSSCRTRSASSRSAGSRPSARASRAGRSATGSRLYLIATCGDCVYCRSGRESLCTAPDWFIGMGTGGAYAEQVPCKASQLIPIPDGVTDVEAAASNIAFGTAWHMLDHARPAPARRDRARQLGRQRDRLGGGAGREARRRHRDRHLEQGRQAGEGRRARPRRRDQLHDAGRRRGGDARHRRPRRRRRLRALSAASSSRGARLAGEGRPARDLRRPRGRGRAVRHHPVLPPRSSGSSARSSSTGARSRRAST